MTWERGVLAVELFVSVKLDSVLVGWSMTLFVGDLGSYQGKRGDHRVAVAHTFIGWNFEELTGTSPSQQESLQSWRCQVAIQKGRKQENTWGKGPWRMELMCLGDVTQQQDGEPLGQKAPEDSCSLGILLPESYLIYWQQVRFPGIYKASSV